MMYRLFICIAWISTAISLSAASGKFDFIVVGGVTYTNVTVFGANATDLFFTSDTGIRNVKLKYLTPDLQKQFNYDSTVAEKAEKQQVEDDKHYQENLAASITADFNAARDARDAEAQAPYSEAGLGDSIPGGSVLGKPVPALDMTKWIGGKPNLTDKFAIIIVWSPKSTSSRKWIPAMNDLSKSLAGKIEVFGITSATESEVLKADPKIDFPCALDPKATFLKAAGISMLPCVILMDANGAMRYQGHPAALNSEAMQNLLKNIAK
jgi:hypothetical protein